MCISMHDFFLLHVHADWFVHFSIWPCKALGQKESYCTFAKCLQPKKKRRKFKKNKSLLLCSLFACMQIFSSFFLLLEGNQCKLPISGAVRLIQLVIFCRKSFLLLLLLLLWFWKSSDDEKQQRRRYAQENKHVFFPPLGRCLGHANEKRNQKQEHG